VLLGLALVLVAVGAPAPLGAAEDPPQPAARLQVVLKEVKVHNAREGLLSGKGEMQFYTVIWRCNEGVPPPCRTKLSSESGLMDNIQGAPIVRAGSLFNADSGDTVTLDQEVPRDGDQIWGGETSQQLGFPVYAGQLYVVRFHMLEWDGDDFNGNEILGDVYHYLDTAKHGLGVGIHTERSWYYPSDGGAGQGDYTLTYEIRPIPPDLRPVSIKVHDLPDGASKRVCMAVQNVEVGITGPFEVALRVDGVVPPGGRATADGLAPGTHRELCVAVALPPGPHTLEAVVDEPGAVAELDETNNVYKQAFTAAQPTPTPSPALPDLTISAIKVNGQVPDGKDDCKDGKNAVTVAVKNASTADAGDFVVRLVVDGDQGNAEEKDVNGLVAGQEQVVKFEDLRLKEGPRSLAATADPQNGITESNEGNNTLQVTAHCGDDD
jgi:hypothetical protein